MKNILIKLKNWLKNNWQGIVIFFLAVCFFVSISGYISHLQQDDFVKWSSPDETANYIFAKLYGQSGDIKIFEKYNLYADETIHPRSFRSDRGFLKPVSFLGIILIYGKIVKFTDFSTLPYLTPFFASLGIFFYYLLIKKIFGKNNAFLSTLLLISFPVWIYYSTRSMFHNVLFVSLLIIGLYFLVVASKKPKKKIKFLNFNPLKINYAGFVSSSLAGIFIGLAMITRTSELLWILPMLFILWVFNIRKIGLLKLALFLCFLFIAITPALFWNQMLYSGFTNSGYPEMNRSIENITGAGGDLAKTAILGKFTQAKEAILKIRDEVFYFGFNPHQTQKMFYYYFVRMFSWIFYPAMLGMFLFLQGIKKWKSRHWAFILSYIAISIILVLYYGSWEFYDNPDKASHTIGNSYTRYWLPVYLGAFPLFSFFLSRFARSLFFKEKRGRDIKVNIVKKRLLDFFTPQVPRNIFLKKSFEIIVIIIIFFISISFVFYGSKEGLVYLAVNNENSREQREEVFALTESNSVIITQYHDKLFFPERKVIVGLLTDDNMNLIYSRLIDYLPVYYYNFTFPEKDFNYLNERRLKNIGFKINEIKKINASFSLYRLERQEKENTEITEENLKSKK